MSDDEDLVDDFLAAAGIGGSNSQDELSASPSLAKPATKKRKKPLKSSISKAKRRRRSSESDTEGKEISEDELEDLVITPPPKARRGAKHDTSLKDDVVFENPYPLEGKYKDEEDREMLLNMTEIEREQVLFSRAEEMQRFKEKRDLAALLDRRDGDHPRRSHRDTNLRSEKAGKRDELSELKKRREEKSIAAKLRTPTKPKTRRSPDAEYSSSENGEISETEAPIVDESKFRITFENVHPMVLSRNFLSRYCHYPQFESTVTGCYTRVRISEKENDYRFARIEGLVQVNKYTVEDVPIDQGLELSQGKSKKVINMDFASNASVTEHEFERYYKELSSGGATMPSKKFLDKKVSEIRKIQEYKLTDGDITAMIAKKKSLSRIPKNLVHEKARLKQLYLAATSSGNDSEAETIQRQIEQLDELAQGSRVKSVSRENEMFLKVNERNRRINMVEMREAERRGVEERRRTVLSTDAAVMDPFSRRKTIPKTFYENLVSSRGGSPAPSSGNNTPNIAPIKDSVPDELSLGPAANGSDRIEEKKVKVEELIAEADFGIDIEI